MNSFDNWVSDSMGVDRDNPIYQNYRSVTSTGLELGSFAMGGYLLILQAKFNAVNLST